MTPDTQRLQECALLRCLRWQYSAPARRASCTAARPVPPDAEWIKMRPPAPSRARCGARSMPSEIQRDAAASASSFFGSEQPGQRRSSHVPKQNGARARNRRRRLDRRLNSQPLLCLHITPRAIGPSTRSGRIPMARCVQEIHPAATTSIYLAGPGEGDGCLSVSLSRIPAYRFPVEGLFAGRRAGRLRTSRRASSERAAPHSVVPRRAI